MGEDKEMIPVLLLLLLLRGFLFEKILSIRDCCCSKTSSVSAKLKLATNKEGEEFGLLIEEEEGSSSPLMPLLFSVVDSETSSK